MNEYGFHAEGTYEWGILNSSCTTVPNVDYINVDIFGFSRYVPILSWLYNSCQLPLASKETFFTPNKSILLARLIKMPIRTIQLQYVFICT